MSSATTKRSEKKVNIPRDVKDEFYRYKMPVLRVKVEGRGNGIKTVLENIVDVARDIGVPPSYPTKFFGFELGALVTISNDRYIVNGKHSAEDLASRLDQFIEKFVLCKYDRNPETEIQITPKGEIVLHCKACGNVTPVDMTHKLASYILNNPPSKAKIPTKHSQVSTKQQRREAKKTKQREDNESDSENETNEVKGSSKTNQTETHNTNTLKSSTSDKGKENKNERTENEDEDEDDDNEVWSTDTSAEAVRRRQLEVFGGSEIAKLVLSDNTDTDTHPEKTTTTTTTTNNNNNKSNENNNVPPSSPSASEFDLMNDLLEYLNKQNPKPNEFFTKVTKIAKIEGWTDRKLITTVFSLLFEKSVVEQLKSRKDYLAPFVNSKIRQKIVLLCIEKAAINDKNIISKIAYILNTLYDADILEEEIILKWFDHPNKKLDPDISTQLRNNAKPFVEWLKNAEEESE